MTSSQYKAIRQKERDRIDTINSRQLLKCYTFVLYVLLVMLITQTIVTVSLYLRFGMTNGVYFCCGTMFLGFLICFCLYKSNIKIRNKLTIELLRL